MLTIAPSRNGPPDSAHGGIAAGSFASLIDPSCASVRFHAPIPLGTGFRSRVADGTGFVEVLSGRTLVATVSPFEASGPAGPIAYASAEELSRARIGWQAGMGADHPFPTCFGCGTQRSDGLGLRPGPFDETGRHVTTWRPDGVGAVDRVLVWAALDCPSGAPALAAVGRNEAVVTGTISVCIHEPVPAAQTLQIVSRLTDRRGRKLHTDAALLATDGRTLATCEAIWLSVPRQAEERAS